VGESVTQTFSATDYALTQGFQQPDSSDNINVFITEVDEITVAVFPNPSAEFINIHFNTQQLSTSEISMFNILGQEVLLPITTSTNNELIDLSSLPASTYFLKISIPSQGFSKTIKIQKITTK
jgi:hypothetical protein